MATTKEIKGRIRSIKNTEKITKAMELVAASKMRKAVAHALGTRAYAHAALSVLHGLEKSGRGIDRDVPLLTVRETGKTLVLVITSNRGLCGAFNARIIKQALQLFKEHGPENLSFVCVGRIGHRALARIGAPVIAAFTDFPETITHTHARQVSTLLIETYTTEEVQKVVSLYTDYESPLTQTPKAEHLLPLKRSHLLQAAEELATDSDATQPSDTMYQFEPNATTVLSLLVERLAQMLIHHHLLESSASEHSARMLAMKNAKEAAGEMMDDLTLAFNKTRQAGITQEISEISAGALTMNT